MARQSLTADRIDKLKPRTRRYAIKDAGCRGLEVRVTPHGVKTLCCVYKAQGKQRRETLGRWPGIGLLQARTKVAEILARRQADPHTITGLVNRYLDSHANSADAERVFRLHINPRIGDQLAARISRGDVLALLDSVKGQGRTIARDVHKHLRAMYYWAMDYEYVAQNPAARISKKRRPELRDSDDDGRALTDDEFKAIWAAAEKMGYPFGTIYQLLMLTGQRRGDWGAASWGEIRDDQLTIPAGRYKVKNAGDHRVPMSIPVRKILKSIPRWTDGHYLFSTTNGARPVSGFSTAAKICEKLSGVHTRPKDFRTTCRTRLSALGIPVNISEMLLGHSQSRIVRIYDLHDYADEIRTALAKYARHVRGVVK